MTYVDKLDDIMLTIRPKDLKPVKLGLQLEKLEAYTNNILLYMDKHNVSNPYSLDGEINAKIFEHHFDISPLMRINSPDVSPEMAQSIGRDFWNTSSNRTRDKKLRERIQHVCLKTVAKALKEISATN